MGFYEPSWDDEGNPEVGYWVDEEPDCPACGDTGRLDDGGRCVWCDPSRWQMYRALLRWWLYRLTRRLRALAGRPDQEEAPF